MLQSFSVTIDSPMVYTGFDTTGYTNFSRAAEISVTAEASVKYDSVTRPIFHNFNGQASPTEGNMFVLTQDTAGDFSISMPDAALTDVSFNEGDIMMLDVAMKGVYDGSSAIITYDLS